MTQLRATSSSLDEALDEEWAAWLARGLARSPRSAWQRSGAEVTTDAGRAVDFSCNDYLGLATDPRIVRAAIETLSSQGAGATASRLIAGTHREHEQLEADLAVFFNSASCVSFATGYSANAGAIPAIVGPRDVIFADALNHASLIDGCRLSRAQLHVYSHADPGSLAESLRQQRSSHRRALIVTDGLFSMDGDLAPLADVVALAREYDAWTYVDDAHAAGVLGPNARGTADHLGLTDHIDVTVGTLGKAFGVAGAFVCGSAVLRRHLLNHARSFVFSTAPMPAQAAASRESLRIVAAEPARRERVRANAAKLRDGLAARGIDARGASDAHVVPVLIGGTDDTVRIGAALRERGLLVGAVRPPTVPDGTSRLRISVSAAHTGAHVDQLVAALAELLPESLMPQPFDVRAVDRAHLWHPYTQHATAGDPIVVARAEGAYLYDESGHRIFDAISSWWVTLHGHAHPAIAAAIGTQAQKLEHVIFAGFTHEPAARLAESLVRIAPPGLTRVFYSDDGSTAVEVATKMVLQFWRNAGESRRTIVALEHAYHGDTFGAMSVSARGTFTAAFHDLLFDVVRLGDPSTHDVAAQLRSLITTRGRELAGVIVEPMLLGAGGMRMWSADHLRGIREATEAAGIPLIADEVLTGFGRTGPLFACNHAGISPDILCLSKGLTGGFLPLGATLATERIFERFVSTERTHTLFHGHSYTANPLACEAARASVVLLDAECAERRAAIERSHRGAADRIRTHTVVRNLRVLGTVLAFEIGADDGYLNAVGQDLRTFAIERGVLLRPLGNTVYILPPYCSTAADLEASYAVIDAFLSRL